MLDIDSGHGLPLPESSFSLAHYSQPSPSPQLHSLFKSTLALAFLAFSALIRVLRTQGFSVSFHRCRN